MQNIGRSARMARHHKRHREATINLVSMIDMMTILVFFGALDQEIGAEFIAFILCEFQRFQCLIFEFLMIGEQCFQHLFIFDGFGRCIGENARPKS